MLYRIICASIMIVFSAFTMAAEEAESKPSGKWGGAAELGIITTRGNTNTTTSNAKLRVEYKKAPWTHQLTMESVRAEDSGTTTADSFLTQYRGKYQFSKRGYYFANLRYEDDPFAGFDQRTAEIVGYGRNLYQGKRFNLDMEVGVGARQTEFTDNTTTDESVIRLGANMDWKISDTSSLTEELFVEDGDKNTVSESTTALKVKINTSLALKVSVKVKDNSEVPVGKKHTDTTTAVTLVYDF